MIKRILLVDDSPVARMIMKKCLAHGQPYVLAEAGNGLEGVAKFKEFRPDITFLDLTMPVMDGFEALPAILAIDPGAMVVIVTADVQQKTIERITELGAFMLLKKPASPEAAQTAIAKVEEYLRNEGGAK